MVLHRTTRWLALTAGLALALPVAAAQAKPAGPVAHAAGGDVPALTPAIVGVPIQRTDAALSNAADAIDAGDGAGAAGPLTASRRYLLRSYSGAKYLIAHPPPPPAEEASASQAAVRQAGSQLHPRLAPWQQRGWIKAHASQDAAGPVFADGVTAVFNVLTSQYSAATTVAGMAPDTKGELLAKVKTSLNTAIVLRNRLVKVVHAAAPPAPAEEAGARAHASQEEGAPTFDVVMPGLTVLLDDELQQMQATAADSTVPADSKAILTSAIAADQQIETLVNQYWPRRRRGLITKRPRARRAQSGRPQRRPLAFRHGPVTWRWRPRRALIDAATRLSARRCCVSAAGRQPRVRSTDVAITEVLQCSVARYFSRPWPSPRWRSPSRRRSRARSPTPPTRRRRRRRPPPPPAPEPAAPVVHGSAKLRTSQGCRREPGEGLGVRHVDRLRRVLRRRQEGQDGVLARLERSTSRSR